MANEGKDIADNNPDIDYEGSEPQNEEVTQDHMEVNPDVEYAKMKVLHDGTLPMPWDMYLGILWGHRA